MRGYNLVMKWPKGILMEREKSEKRYPRIATCYRKTMEEEEEDSFI